MKKIIKIAVLVLILGFFAWLQFAPSIVVGYAPEQPIPYDHALHAGEYNIDCRYCHTGIVNRGEPVKVGLEAGGKRAGVPSLNICMNCHTSVAFGKPTIQKIYKQFKANKPMEWIRVHNMPDHVKFSHKPHISALHKPGAHIKEACKVCHGDVDKMQVVEQVKSLNMGFCIDCHRDNKDKKATTSCSTCHY